MQYWEKGNELWRRAENPGRPPKIKSPEHLWEKALEYFQWVSDHPVDHKTNLQRPMTIKGFAIFCGMSYKHFCAHYTKEEFGDIAEKIKDIIFTQKFEGAVLGCYKENIIARESGLADKQENSGPDGKPEQKEITVTFVDVDGDKPQGK